MKIQINITALYVSVCVPAEDGALLGKIEKVRVLRNDRREGTLEEEGFIITFMPERNLSAAAHHVG